MKSLLLVAYAAVLVSGYVLRWLNLRHLRVHAGEVPPEFEGRVDAERLQKVSEYTLHHSRTALVESILDSALLIIFIFGGLLPLYDRWIASLADSFILRGILFFLVLSLLQSLLDIPFSLYRTFRLEARFGFNTTTVRVWSADLIKSTLLSALLLALLGGGALWLVESSPERWWLWVWLFFAAATLFLMYLSPYLIEPLFYRFEPLREEGLEEEIRRVMERTGIKVKSVLQVDASRRSRHSNAYFTGIGHVKRIVLFDTLLRQMSHGEIIAVLAHEVGHWVKGHVVKRLLLAQLFGFAAILGSFLLLRSGILPQVAGLPPLSFPAQLVVLSFLWSLVSFPFTPFSAWLSRRQEREADLFAARISGKPAELASALVTLTTENLSNLHPHPLYAAFYYSHPPVTERVRRLRGAEEALAAQAR